MDVLTTVAVLIVMMVVLIYLSGWFSGSETALTNLNSSDIAEMRRKHTKNAEYIFRLKRNMDRTLITILVGNNVVNILLSSLAALIANTLFHAIGVSLIIGLITFLIIIFGEISPKSIAIIDSRKVASRNSKAIYYMMKIINPLITFFIHMSRGIIRMSGGKVKKKLLLVTDESIKDLASLGEEEGVIKPIERSIIHRVFGFGDSKVRQVMVPLGNVFRLTKDLSIEEASEIVSDAGFTRVPIVEDGKVIGLLYSKDLVAKNEGKIESLIRPPFVVPADRDVTSIFSAMRNKRIHMAIVKDEEGKQVGIVTLEDILEELVGEIYDEYFETKYKNGSKFKAANNV